VAAVQYTFTHKQYAEYTKYITIKKMLLSNLGSAGCASICASYTLAFALQLRKKHGKPQLG
jgi:hypothetical protein